MKQTKKRSIKAKKDDVCCTTNMCSTNNGCGGAFYGLGILGAAIYYIQASTGFWAGVLGVLKALVWPVFLVYDLMKFLGM